MAFYGSYNESLYDSLAKPRGSLDREALHRLLDELLDLRERTDPRNCADPATVSVRLPNPEIIEDGYRVVEIQYRVGKHAAALHAALNAAAMMTSIAGWANRHLAGHALADDGGDGHQSEDIGVAMDRQLPPDPEARRAVLLALLEYAPFPDPLWRELADALRALNLVDTIRQTSPQKMTNFCPLQPVPWVPSVRFYPLGEVQPLLAPKPVGFHGPGYTLAKLRLTALEVANFLHGSGSTLISAEHRVAKALGVPQTTLKSWETRLLPGILGAHNVKRAIGDARRAGKLHTELYDDPDRRAAILEFVGAGESLDLIRGERLAAVSLADLGRKYRAVKRGLKED